ncbi:ac57 [Hemileuca sp. nucleopolyhedrovirus]|uniref:Ac57 n=1 Tax=Hemileuca sp. nucleopolyhedrovirus TaxID=1367203 RepID=S5MQ50_9ABAC|nr:ac57 [Hemileuca sp. nucleopolyhedrovirus]AGR56798.1 ac57 [Hemileuca sp. nucleopolyhedrovirus]
MTTVNVKYLEFGGTSLDLRHVSFPHCNKNEANNNEYIVFLNVKKAFFRNFKIISDLSLESLTYYIYENVKCTIDGKESSKNDGINKVIDYNKFVFNEHDKNRSIIIEFDSNARIIVASAIRPDEFYHQRVSGYVDFENRHTTTTTEISPNERDALDREYEIKLLNYN